MYTVLFCSQLIERNHHWLESQICSTKLNDHSGTNYLGSDYVVSFLDFSVLSMIIFSEYSIARQNRIMDEKGEGV